MNKKVLTGAIIGLAILIVGGVTYYFYNLASADPYNQIFCAGLTGRSWRNCVDDMTAWRKFMQTHSNKEFERAIKTLYYQRNID